MAWLTGWSYRKQITIDSTKIDSDLTDFPILVKLTSTNFDFTKALSSGNDIRFTSSDGTTLLSYERERHDSTNSVAEYWVKIPSVSSSTDTTFYVYYGNSSASDGADATNVWDSNYVGVWHLNQDPSGTAPQILDSTSNNNDGTANGSMTSSDLVDAQVGKGLDFDGSDDDVEVPDPSTDLGSAFTVEYWVKMKSGASGNYTPMVCKNGATNNNYPGPFSIRSNNDAFPKDLIFYYGSDSGVANIVVSDVFSQDTWAYVTAKFDSTNGAELYKDGSSIGTNSTTSNVADNNQKILFAQRLDNLDFADITIDEVRISNTARSDAWIKATYNSESDNLNTFGSEETEATAYTLTLSETFTLSDVTQRKTTFLKSLTENLSLSDIAIAGRRVILELLETLKLVENKEYNDSQITYNDINYRYDVNSTTIKGLGRTLPETIHLSDTLNRLTKFKKTITETISLSDTLSKIQGFVVSILETIHLTDITSRLTTFAKTIVETLHITDIINVGGGWFREIKHSSLWTKGSKHSSSWTDDTKHSSPWTNKTKH